MTPRSEKTTAFDEDIGDEWKLLEGVLLSEVTGVSGRECEPAQKTEEKDTSVERVWSRDRGRGIEELI